MDVPSLSTHGQQGAIRGVGHQQIARVRVASDPIGPILTGNRSQVVQNRGRAVDADADDAITPLFGHDEGPIGQRNDALRNREIPSESDDMPAIETLHGSVCQVSPDKPAAGIDSDVVRLSPHRGQHLYHPHRANGGSAMRERTSGARDN
ncbi:MAG: hypothetical protein DLM70_08415 [Chloroflexi bacterium]|nr:MAG: hypothetical protein DLM70_08415 [Chloroflexota bacterium]